MFEIKAQVVDQWYVNMGEKVIVKTPRGYEYGMITVYDPKANGNWRKMIIYPPQLEEVRNWYGLARITSLIVRFSGHKRDGRWVQDMSMYAVLAPVAQVDPEVSITSETVRNVVDDDLLSVLDSLETNSKERKIAEERAEKVNAEAVKRGWKRAKRPEPEADVKFAGEDEGEDAWA